MGCLAKAIFFGIRCEPSLPTAPSNPLIPLLAIPHVSSFPHLRSADPCICLPFSRATAWTHYSRILLTYQIYSIQSSFRFYTFIKINSLLWYQTEEEITSSLQTGYRFRGGRNYFFHLSPSLPKNACLFIKIHFRNIIFDFKRFCFAESSRVVVW